MKENYSKKDIREFGMVLALILAVFSFLHFRKGHENAYLWLSWFSGVSFISGIMFPEVLLPVLKVFTRLAHALGWFNTRVILIMVYYLILMPIGLIMRLLGNDILDKRISGQEKTFWKKRPVTKATKESLEKQF